MKKIFQEMWKDKGKAILVVLLTIISVMAELFMPNYMSRIVNEGIPKGDIGFIFRIGVQMLGVVLIAAFCTVLAGYFSSIMSAAIGKRLRFQLFSKVESFSLEEFDKFSTSSLITRTTNDVLQIQNFTQMFLRIIIMAPLMAIGGILLAAEKSPKASIVVMISVPILIVSVLILAKIALPLSQSMQEKLDQVNLVMREKLTGIRVIRAFGTTDHEENRFHVANRDLAKTTIKMQRTMSAMMPLLTIILNFTTIAIVWTGGMMVAQNEMLVGDVMAVVQYVMQIMMSFTMMSMIFIMYPRASASAKRINEVLETKPSIVDKAQTIKEPSEKGSVEFKNVTFRFTGSDEPTLQNISFSAKPGETTAIIGSTGSGKSTVVNLIPRFYDATEGQILVDGVDVREYSQDVLRSKIGYVPQKALLFKGSIKENIRFGLKSAPDDRIEKSLEIAQAADFVSSKPEGIESIIAQGGSNVSGGQKQRLSIARAVVRKPEIYIFDDSFSALDFKTDATLRQALKEETKESTVLIVAQRVSTIMDSDTILVLEEGKMVGKGTHKELLKSCEVYHEIVLSQLSEEEIA